MKPAGGSPTVIEGFLIGKSDGNAFVVLNDEIFNGNSDVTEVGRFVANFNFFGNDLPGVESKVETGRNGGQTGGGLGLRRRRNNQETRTNNQ